MEREFVVEVHDMQEDDNVKFTGMWKEVEEYISKFGKFEVVEGSYPQLISGDGNWFVTVWSSRKRLMTHQDLNQLLEYGELI